MDIRIQIPKCPLELQVPHIPGGHTAIVIDINTPDIDWQERMISWTLASLINNTDIVMKGVHLYVQCEESVKERVADATAKIEIQNAPGVKDNKIVTYSDNPTPLITLGEHGFAYDHICQFDINYWAFRSQNQEKLPLGHILKHTWGWAAADYSIHPLNDITQKNNQWLPIPEPKKITEPYAERGKRELATHLLHTGHLAKWLHAVNTAVYGEDYKKRRQNIATHFFNEHEANWHINTSILKYSAQAANDPTLIKWMTDWKHLSRDAVIALYLFKTQQHAYNLQDSIIIETPRFEFRLPEYPQLCNMRYAATNATRDAIKAFLGERPKIAIEGETEK